MVLTDKVLDKGVGGMSAVRLEVKGQSVRQQAFI